MSNLDSNNDHHVGYAGDGDIDCPYDQVQPGRMDSTFEMRLSNLPSTAPGDKRAGMWDCFSLDFAIGYVVFGSVYLVFVNVYSVFWSVPLVFRECFWYFRLYVRYLGFRKVYQVVYWSKGAGLRCQRWLIVESIEMETT